jgi:cardiolipin synthase A/B
MPWLFYIYYCVGWVICAGMVLIVLRRQFASGAALAWLMIVFLHPYIGLCLYLLVGENRLGPHRTEIYLQIARQFRSRWTRTGAALAQEHAQVDAIYHPLVLQAEKISGLPICPANAVEFITDSAPLIDRMVADIDAAQHHVHLLYYIFFDDGTGRKIADALSRAAKCGVQCRVLVDSMASRDCFHDHGLAARLAADKIKFAAAMPVTSIKRGLSRMDMRNHRKLAVIDDRIAFAGSHNLIDPRYGGRRGAPWIDVTGRYSGPIVTELATVFSEDWAFETGEMLIPSPDAVDKSTAGALMQAVPTGPSAPGETYRRLLLGAIQCARQNIVLTTPYFVPDEPTLVALLMAADRGVDVKLILPMVSDSIFTAAAGRAHFSRLMAAGISIHLFRPGLLHAKTTTVDDAYAIFGSANLDVRSFNLNFELSVMIYDAEVTRRLHQIQVGYLGDSIQLSAQEWAARPAWRRYSDGAISLLSPLL